MGRITNKSNHKKTSKPVIAPAKNGIIYDSFIVDDIRYMICENSIPGGPYFKGKQCFRHSKVANDTVKILCFECTAKLVPYEEKVYKKSDKPRGWAFMSEYVHKDGTVYHRGKEQPELKGTLPPTKPKEKQKKLTKQQKLDLTQPLFIELTKLKQQHKKEKRKTYRAKLQTKINKINRELKKIK